jgi:hypothetical protein
MADAIESLIPVATLLLGAGLANLLKFTELRRSLRLDAADQLAEVPALLWNKSDPNAWIKMNAAMSRLAIRLNLAGVHPELTERLQKSASAFWHSVYSMGHDDEGEVWGVGTAADETWTEISTLVADLLSTNSRVRAWWISRRARRLLKMWDEHEKALLASLAKSED